MRQTPQPASADTILIRVPERLAGAVRAALEDLALQGYRDGSLSLFQVSELLGLKDRFETEACLAGSPRRSPVIFSGRPGSRLGARSPLRRIARRACHLRPWRSFPHPYNLTVATCT